MDVDRLLEPRAPDAGTLRCRVHRIREKNTLEVFIEEGNIFVLSAVRQGKDWLISERMQGSPAMKHLARIKSHKDRTFTCSRGRYDGGEAPP